jgi:uncharacterized protein (DUF1810 family)
MPTTFRRSLPTPEIDLDRFVDAQRVDFDRALAEITTGRKRSHWMWYVFPQVAGLGFSAMSQRYAIKRVAEAKAFLSHPVLGPRYRQIVDAVWSQVVEGGITVHALFGSPDDAKLVSSLTLFAAVGRAMAPSEPALGAFATRADEILEAAYAQQLARCMVTERFVTP